MNDEDRRIVDLVDRALADRAWHFGAEPCPMTSSVTGLPCVLLKGHDQASPLRFHKFPERVAGDGAIEFRAPYGAVFKVDPATGAAVREEPVTTNRWVPIPGIDLPINRKQTPLRMAEPAAGWVRDDALVWHGVGVDRANSTTCGFEIPTDRRVQGLVGSVVCRSCYEILAARLKTLPDEVKIYEEEHMGQAVDLTERINRISRAIDLEAREANVSEAFFRDSLHDQLFPHRGPEDPPTEEQPSPEQAMGQLVGIISRVENLKGDSSQLALLRVGVDLLAFDRESGVLNDNRRETLANTLASAVIDGLAPSE